MGMSSIKPPKKKKAPGAKMAASLPVKIVKKASKAPGSPNIRGKKIPNTFGNTQANSVPGLQDSEDMIVP